MALSLTQIRTRADFDALIPDEPAARAVFIAIRWPDGASCARCGGRDLTWLKTRDLCQCNTCRWQTSVKSGTVMERSKMPLRDWLYVAWRCGTMSGASASSIASELGRRYPTVFGMVHKLRAALKERGVWQLEAPVEVGTGLIRPTKRAKGDPPHRPPVLTAMVLDPTREGPDLLRTEVAVSPEQTAEELHALAVARHVHRPTQPRWPTPQLPHAVRGELGRLKLWLTQLFGGVSRRYLANYDAQFDYVGNRWRNRHRLFEWMVRRLVTEPWHPFSALGLPP